MTIDPGGADAKRAPDADAPPPQNNPAETRAGVDRVSPGRISLQALEADIRAAERAGDIVALTNCKLDYAYALSYGYKRHEKSIACYRKVLNTYETHKRMFNDHDRAYVCRFLGNVYLRNLDIDNAIKTFQRGLNVIEKTRKLTLELKREKARLLYNIGSAYNWRSVKEVDNLIATEKPDSQESESQTQSQSSCDDNPSQYHLEDSRDYASMDDEPFVFGSSDDLEQVEHYFHRLLEFIREYGDELAFDDQDREIGGEAFCIIKVAQARINRYRTAKPYSNNIDLAEVLDLFDQILDIWDGEREDEIMYKKACIMCLLGPSYRAKAIELFEAIIDSPKSRTYFKRRSYEQSIAFTLRIGAFSICKQLIHKSSELLDEKYVTQRLNRVQEIEQIFISEPSEGLAAICSEKGEYHAASDLYLEMLQDEKDLENRINFWLDKEAALEGWLKSFDDIPGIGPEDYDMGKDTSIIVTEARFAYLHCLDQLRSLPHNASNAKRYNGTLLEYAKFISRYNADEATQVFQSIIESPTASAGHKSAALNAIKRLKSTPDAHELHPLGVAHVTPGPESPNLKSISPSLPVEVINISDEDMEPAPPLNSSQTSSPVGNGTNRKRPTSKRGQAIRRKTQSRRRVVVESSDTDDIICSESSEEENRIPVSYVDNSADQDFGFSEADAARISKYSEKEIQNKLREEKANLQRPVYLAFYNLELATRLHDNNNLEECLPYYEQAAAFCPPGAELRLIDFKNLYFNMGKVHRTLGHWDCAIPNLKRASELYDTRELVLECADSFIELGHLFSDEAEKLERNEYALAFRRCLGRVSFKYFEESRRRLFKAKGKCDEKRRLELLSHVLSNEAISWLVQENGEQAAKTIRHAISHCRQYGGLENWLCQSLNTSHDINKFLRRLEEARVNLRECLQQAKLKGGEEVPFFDFDNADIGKADGECFGCYYWNSKLSLAKVAAQMHKLGDAQRLVRELVDKRDSFHQKFQSMVAVTRDHVESLGVMLTQRDELIAVVSNQQSGELLEDVRKLCKICEDAEDFENLIVFADKWSQLATDQSEKYTALDALYLGYKDLRRLKEAAAALHAMCSFQDAADVDCRIKFLNLYKLALLYDYLEGRESANLKSVVSEMESRFPDIESEFKESPTEILPFKAAMLDIELITCGQGNLGEFDEKIVALHKEWKTNVDESSAESSEDSFSEESYEDESPAQDSPQRLSRRLSRAGTGNLKRSRQRSLSNRPGAHSGRSRRSNHSLSSSVVQAGESGGRRVPRSLERVYKNRRTSNESQNSARICTDKERPLTFVLRQQRRPSGEQRQISNTAWEDGVDTNMADCVDHLQGMLSGNELNDNDMVDNDLECENITDHSMTSASVVQPAFPDSASARIFIDHFQFLITCNTSQTFQGLIDEVTERFYREQARRPIIKHLLLDGAIVDSSDLVIPLIRSHSDAKFVAVVSHYQDVALSVSYQTMCETNQDEYSLNLDILDRLAAVTLQTVDISYIISLPNSIAPLIKILPRQSHHLTELVFDCSGFNDACALLLADVIGGFSSLKKVSLAATFVTAVGASAVMKKCKSLQSFDIHAVDLSDLQLEIIELFLQSNPSLEFADFSFCKLTRFPSPQAGRCSIRSLNLSGNCFSDSAVISDITTTVSLLDGG